MAAFLCHFSLLILHELIPCCFFPWLQQNDLLRRLRKIVEELEDDDVEPLSPDYPGLNGLAAALVDDKYLQHKDKEVRLHTVLACAEIFTVVRNSMNLVVVQDYVQWRTSSQHAFPSFSFVELCSTPLNRLGMNRKSSRCFRK
jgi:hypothetical protein